MTRQFPLPPVDVETKLRPDCKAHIMELFPDLFMELAPLNMQLSSYMWIRP